MTDVKRLEELARSVRYYILRMTTKAGSGHATSALSATDLMVALFFNHLSFDINQPDNPANDRVVFSKGHASPLLYALYAAAGVLSEKDLDSYRKFGSPLEGHPTPRFKFVEVATGSLGQGLSVGLGMALALRARISNYHFAKANETFQISNSKKARDTRDTLGTRDTFPKVYVLMGDSETSEGAIWEAIQLASYYQLGNLVGIIDVNRLGQSGETMLGWDVLSYKKRIEGFGWRTEIVDGHDFNQILPVFSKADEVGDKPLMIIAKTVKGKGVSFLENKEGWHGKALSEEDFEKAVVELGDFDKTVRGEIKKPEGVKSQDGKFSTHSVNSVQASSNNNYSSSEPSLTRRVEKLPFYKLGEMVATRKAYGEAITKLGAVDERIVCLDAEVKNSTFAEVFAQKFPDRFIECFIAEQNMVGMAAGLAARGRIPFVSTFAAFLTRAYDQIRMAAISGANIKFVGSHSGVSIGEDGPSQMGLEDLAMFRTVFGSIVFCPADAVACAKLVEIAAETEGIFYIRCARPPTPVIYIRKPFLRIRKPFLRIEKEGEEFKIGGSKVVRSSKNDKLTIVACGVTVFEAVSAAEKLVALGINVRVIDAYSIKPIDEKTLHAAANETNNTIITCEDHYFEGGLGDAVLNVFANDEKVRVFKLAVNKLPMSGKSGELLDYEEISAGAIVNKVRSILK